MQLSELDKQLLYESSSYYLSSDKRKNELKDKIRAKLDDKSNNNEFDDTEYSLMFEFLAGYVNNDYLTEVNDLRERLRIYKFPDQNEHKQ